MKEDDARIFKLICDSRSFDDIKSLMQSNSSEEVGNALVEETIARLCELGLIRKNWN